MDPICIKRWIRLLLWFFIVCLFLSGATAIPLETEVRFLTRIVGAVGDAGWNLPGLQEWLLRVRDALIATNAQYPFMAYGTDWLAFGHFMIALAFVGPLRDPVKNVWVVEFGMIACVLVVPYAMVLGGLRGVPFWWRLIDCSFGVFGIVPLWWCRRLIVQLSRVP